MKFIDEIWMNKTFQPSEKLGWDMRGANYSDFSWWLVTPCMVVIVENPRQIFPYIEFIDLGMIVICPNTVDGRNPVPPGMYRTL